MSLLNQKLSALKPGTKVRFTHISGQTFDGIITENDGKESLAVQIMSVATLRYDQISIIDENLKSEIIQIPETKSAETDVNVINVVSDSVNVTEDPDNKTDSEEYDINTPISFDKNTVSKAFKDIDHEKKKKLSPANDKIQSYFKSHEESKCEEALDLIWKEMNENKWDYDRELNRYLAQIEFICGNIFNCVVSFFYGNNIRTAYLISFQEAENSKDKELYRLSAAFSTIYIIYGDACYLKEAFEVLKKSSMFLSDISGFDYLSKEELSKEADSYLSDAVKLISIDYFENANLLLTDKLLNMLKGFYREAEIEKIIVEYIDKMPEKDKVSKKDTDSNAEADNNKVYEGRITKYKFYEDCGSIETSDGQKYDFNVNDISDMSLNAQVKKISTTKISAPIPVKFQILKFSGKYMAVNIKRGSENSKVSDKPLNEMQIANTFFTQKKYNEAIKIYQKNLENDELENAFASIISCYLCLWNERGDMGYSQEIEKIVNQYKDKIILNTKNLEILQQYYMRVQNYSDCIDILNKLMEICEPNKHGRILHYLIGKERCYRALNDYPSAISQLLDWLDIVKRNKMVERYANRDNQIYSELAELYFEAGDYENAEKYANLSKSEERKQAILRKIEEVKAEIDGSEQNLDEQPTEIYDEPDETENEEELIASDDSIESEENIQAIYDSYGSDSDFDSLKITDEDIVKRALEFKPEKLYCLLTYLKAAAEISADSVQQRVSVDGDIIYINQAVQAVNDAFGYAFNSPLSESEYTSMNIISVFEMTKQLIPDINSKLFVSATMYALFNNSQTPDYNIDDLVMVAESFNFEQFPSLIPLINNLYTFKSNTGYGIDIYADYKTSNKAIENIISEASDICVAIDMRLETFESQGQVRRMRKYLFAGDDSELRMCLDVVKENNINKYQFVKETMAEFFIKNNRPITSDNADIKKIDKYIDRFWDVARDVIIKEKRTIERPHDKIKGSKRTNIIITIRRIISCICDWLAVAEHSSSNDNFFAKNQYDELVPQIVNNLSELISACETELENNFDWGTESIRYAAKDLLSKLNDTYDSRLKKYFFADFLTDGSVLLDEDYMPEIKSSFCFIPEFNILRRIENHSEKQDISLNERISEIFSNIESNHNFRSARLIKNYAENMGLTEISEHKDFEQYNECLKQAKQRFKAMYSDFANELELFEIRGNLSNINGEKDKIMSLALDWYKITGFTNEYGFYAELLEALRNKIYLNSIEKGERLTKQLEELASDSKYDFGIYTNEQILSIINDQNYTSAEFILNCIRRGDTKTVTDYSAEPFGYFNDFINEHATNYRAVVGAGKDISHNILEYSGKRDLEKALKQITNNARKETKGGANLIKNWLPLGGRGSDEGLIERLLSSLGFKPISVKRDLSLDTEAYNVLCRRQIGKTNYVHPIPAFGSKSEENGFRVICLYGKYDCDSLMDKFRSVNTVEKHTMVLLDFALNLEERRKLARKIKEEKTFSSTFIVVDRVILFCLARHYAENTVIKRLMAITFPFSYYQPFVEKKMSPELFTGRETELTSIESPNGANLVYGGRQLGKTALLEMAKRHIDKNGNGDRAVLLDIKERTSKEAAEIVSRELIIEGILDESCQCNNWSVLAGHIKKRLMDENPETRINYLLLMLDEADIFIKTSSETDDPPISALKNLPSNRFKIVMAGLHNLSRYNREMLHKNSNLIHLTPIVIKQFRRKDAIKLLTNILAYLGFHFSDEIISNIIASTNYYPGLIQFYCQKLLEAMKSDDYAGYSETKTPNYEVNESHFKKILADTDFMDEVNRKLEATLFAEEKGRSNYHIIALILAFLYYSSPADGYKISDILKVAEDYNITRITSLKSEQLEEILNEMWDLNVLTVMDEYYSFATEGFRELLGSPENVEKSISLYIEEGEVK